MSPVHPGTTNYLLVVEVRQTTGKMGNPIGHFVHKLRFVEVDGPLPFTVVCINCGVGITGFRSAAMQREGLQGARASSGHGRAEGLLGNLTVA